MSSSTNHAAPALTESALLTHQPPAVAESLQRQTGAGLTDLVEVMNRLLAPAPDGCPWDREQTLQTLRSYLIEEAYEVIEALDHNDATEHRDELGDVLFQIVFQSALRAREGSFGIDDVCSAITKKMKHRHPHVFADAKVEDAQEVVKNWGQIKAAEQKQAGKVRRTLDGVPAALPALLQAQRLGDKAAAVGFDWPDVRGVRDKLDEELQEMDEALGARGTGKEPTSPQAQAALEHEIGDVLFTMTRLAAKLGVSPEDALRSAIQRFSARFNTMEDLAQAQTPNSAFRELSLDQMNVYWEAAKSKVG